MSVIQTIWNDTLNSFCEKTASSDPTPGGGSVSSVSALLGASLVRMAVEITLKNSDSVIIKESKRSILELTNSLAAYADKDIEVFNQYIEALKMPKNSAEEKELRSNAMKIAIFNATQTPIQTAEVISKIMEDTAKITPFIKKDVISDIGSGIYLLESALNAVLLNVAINLPYIRDEDIKMNFLNQQNLIKTNSKNYFNQCIELVNKILNI